VSWLDIPVLSAVAELSFVAKSEVARWPAIGLMARLQRSVFVERAHRHKTRHAASLIARRLALGDAIVLFAEGTTSDGTRVLPFRSALIGAVRETLGPQTECAYVQPVAIRYARRHGLPIGRAGAVALAWIGDTDLMPHLVAVLAGGPLDVTVSFGEAIAFVPGSDRKGLARTLEGSVRSMMRRQAGRDGPP
jgi:1-acyl-sn-glycerol-3-phosphate acyltransferase